MKLYGLKNCDTCRKAMKWLSGAGIACEFIDVRRDGVSQKVLVKALAELGVTQVVNTRSTTWRGLSDADRALEPLSLLASHASLMKRPLIVGKDWLSVGWTPEIISGLEARIPAA